MSEFIVRVEFAVLLDLDLKVEAANEDAAFEIADEAIMNVGPLSAIADQLSALSPSFVGGDVQSDARVLLPPA